MAVLRPSAQRRKWRHYPVAARTTSRGGSGARHDRKTIVGMYAEPSPDAASPPWRTRIPATELAALAGTDGGIVASPAGVVPAGSAELGKCSTPPPRGTMQCELSTLWAVLR